MAFRLRVRRVAGLAAFGAVLVLAQDWKTATTLDGVDLTGLDGKAAATALKLMREYDCTCGCGMKVAQCRVEDPQCSYSKGIAGALAKAIRDGKDEAGAVAAAKASRYGTPPPPPKLLEDPVPIATDGSPFQGPANAPVTIIEFSDFQCPYCYQAAAQLREVLKSFPTQVRLVFRQFPLDTHSQAAVAAAAAIAAHRQGKFWPLHDAMFANRTRLSRPTIEQLASKVGLDMPRFEKDWPSQETANTVIRDMQDGEKAGVEGTPSIFVNGKHYRGSLELAPFSKIIEGELKK